MAQILARKILIIIFINNLIFVESQQQYSAQILSPSPSSGPGGSHFFNSSSFRSPRPGHGGGNSHLHPGPGHPLSQLSQYEYDENKINFNEGNPASLKDVSESASSFLGSGFPPSRLPPSGAGESYGHGGGGPLGRPPANAELDYENNVVHQDHGQIPSSSSKSISGDYCWDPLFSCDTPKTILYCVNGRCSCPTGWTLTPGSLPLNTVWDPSSKRCLSLLGSGCHVSPSAIGNGYVYCQPGVSCVPHPQWREVGTCGTSSLIKSIELLVMMVLILHLFGQFV